MKRTALIILALSLITISTDAFAAKLVWMKVLDKDYLQVYFQDGDACFMDTGTGSKAYTGDHYYGWDWVASYGSALNTTNAVATANWVIKSSDDATYGTTGKNPTNCYRKSKLTGMSEGEWSGSDYVYTYAMEHTIYLRLPYPLSESKTYTIEINSNTNTDVTSKSLTYDIFNCPSEAVHVNLVGYLADASTKAVDLYIWMGRAGNANPGDANVARDYSTFVGKKVYIYNVDTTATQEVGTVALWKTSTTEAGGFNLTMSNVWKADFTGFNTPGTYRIAIEGVGCSENFEIKKYAYFEPFRVSTLGYFYMRVGEDSNFTNMPVPRRPLYIPGVSPSNTKVYITTVQPWDSNWASIPDDKWDNPDSWAAYKKAGSPQNNNAYGGHSDAADWDRHLGHIINIYDMLLPYILTDGRLNDDNLQIAESGNGIPDLLDEARNEVDFWLRLRDGDGYSFGLTNPNGSNILYQAGNTPMAAWASAANASMLANCFMLAGINDLRDYYTNAAVTAYNYASGLPDQMLTTTQGVGNYTVRGKDLKMMAAAYLYNLTGNTAYEDMMSSLSDITSTTSTVASSSRNQLWACAAYLKTKRTVHYSTLFSNMKASIINEAKSQETNYTSSRPTRRATDNNLGSWWKTAHNVERSVVAHAVADSNSDKTLFENALVLEADWGLGRNSINMIYMTTAKTNLANKRSVENCYTTGRNDGSPGMHPGHTPYLNIQDWWDGMVMFMSSYLTNKSYPAFGGNSTGWPKGESYFNTRYIFSHSEFTPQQTMCGKAALYGYLYGLYKIAADFDGDSDVDMLDLADFADSWLKVPSDADYDSRANLYVDPSGIVDFYDFAVFANQWKPVP